MKPLLMNPYVYGYTLLFRQGQPGPVEVWHYASDRLVHVATDEWEAVGWARRNSAIPKSAKSKRHWHELWGPEGAPWLQGKPTHWL